MILFSSVFESPKDSFGDSKDTFFVFFEVTADGEDAIDADVADVADVDADDADDAGTWDADVADFDADVFGWWSLTTAGTCDAVETTAGT